MGLKVPLSLLLEELEDECNVVDTRSKDAIIENDGKMRAFPVFPFDPTRNVEIFYNVFHSYNNPYQEPCVIYNMIFYPRT